MIHLRKRIVRALVISFVALLLTGAVCIAILTGTRWGLSVIGRAIEAYVTDSIPGFMTIGEVKSFGWFHPVVDDLNFYDPEGRRVIHVEHADVKWNVADIFRRRIGFHKARAERGEVVIQGLPNGWTSIEMVFSTPDDPSLTPEQIKAEEAKLPDIKIDNLYLEDIRLAIGSEGDTQVAFCDLTGFMRIWRYEPPGVRLQFNKIKGQLCKPEIMGKKVDVKNLEGWIRGTEKHVLHLDLNNKLGDSGLDMTVDFFDREKEPLVLEIKPDTGSGARIAARAWEVRGLISKGLDVKVEP